MALPPRGDPRRPLMLAVSSCRLLGAIGLLLGTCAGVPLLGGMGRRGFGPPVAWAMLSLVLLLGGGAAYLVFAHFVGRRRFWAVVSALVMTSVLLLMCVVGLVATLVVVLVVQPGLRRSSFGLIGPGIYALATLALGQLVYHLARSITALNMVPPGEVGRGFEVMPVADTDPPRPREP